MQPATTRINIVAKENLARLLATENIRITHNAQAATASFDPNTRHLVLPVWSKASDDVYDLLVGHEVGHALHSPTQDVTDPICNRVSPDNPTLFFRYMNVIEDIRIENAIKTSFPGIRRSFYNGYKELSQNDFFGVSPENIDSLCLADRINIHAKIGQYGFIDVPFSDEERQLLDRAMSVNSFDDVIAVAEAVFQHRDTPEPKQQDQQQQTAGQTPNKGPSGEGKGESESEPGEDRNDDNSQQKQNKNPDVSGNNGIGQTEQSSYETHRTPAPDMSTDRMFEQMTKQMRSNSFKDEIHYFDLPKIDMSTILFDWRRVMSDMARSVRAVEGFSGEELLRRVEDRNKNFVLNLVKQFEQKMAADTIARTSYRRTGELDMRRISNYRFSDDIFQKNTIVQKGKNHGMVLVMDWSGSMADCLLPTAEQVMALVLFCRRMRIPFEVYAFTNRSPLPPMENAWDRTKISSLEHNLTSPDYSIGQTSYGEYYVNYDKYLRIQNIGMIHFLSSDMNNKEFREAAQNFLQVAADNDGSGSDLLTGLGRSRLRYTPDTEETRAIYAAYDLSGTPLIEATYVAIDLVNQFRAKHRLDIVNTLFMTDGDPSSVTTERYGVKTTVVNLPNRRQMVLVQEKKNEGYYSRPCNFQLELEGMVRLFRAMTGSNAIRMYLRSGNIKYFSMHGLFQTEKNPQAAHTEALRCWKDNNFFSYNDDAHDQCFVINSGVRVFDDPLAGINEGATVTQIARAFIKNSEKRSTSRVLLSRLSDIIAKQIRG